MSAALTEIGNLVSTAMDIITGNTVLMVAFCGGLVGVGFRIISQARRASGAK